MVDAYHTTFIVLGLIALLLLIPAFECIPRLKDHISRRYIITIVILAIFLGAIIDFGHLSDSVRLAVVLVCSVSVLSYLILMSIEKWMANGWGFNHNLKASVSKGDAKAEIEIKNVEKKDEKKDESDLKGLAKYEQGE